jgi:hypothetical protein
MVLVIKIMQYFGQSINRPSPSPCPDIILFIYNIDNIREELHKDRHILAFYRPLGQNTAIIISGNIGAANLTMYIVSCGYWGISCPDIPRYYYYMIFNRLDELNLGAIALSWFFRGLVSADFSNIGTRNGRYPPQYSPQSRKDGAIQEPR